MGLSVSGRCVVSVMALLALGVAGAARGAALPEPTTGILYDRVLPLSGIERFDGRGGPAVRPGTWWQIYDELRRATTAPSTPDAVTLRQLAGRRSREGVIPLALLDYRYQRLTPAARDLARRNQPTPAGEGEALEQARAFAAAALTDLTHRGGSLRFVLDRGFVFGDARAARRIEADFDDGLGFRPLGPDQVCGVSYASIGEKAIRLRATLPDGEAREARVAFTVAALAAPSPNDTLHVTATIPYQGQFGSGDAYVYLAPGRSALLNPVVVVEGFDIDNSYNWDELYQLLNQQNLIETLRADGYDAVVLNFTEATDYLQKNAFVVTALLQQVQAMVGPQTTVALVGASMGGLVSRYALAYMEGHSLVHPVRTFISFDAPQKGADIPLGIQYWMKLFSGQSADAAFLLSRLDQPGARQMLVYHYTDPPSSTGQADPLRADFLADLVASGDFPTGPRTVAVANGSGSRVGQGFAPGDQIIRYEYSVPFLVNIRGNVWAVPDASSHVIFDGLIRIFGSGPQQTVTVSGTQPFDNAPGGSRATMTQMDTTAAPYGDIIALHPSHCFIPTISALALDTNNLFYDIAGDPALLTHTPFDAVYFPTANQEHVTITPENAIWLRTEIENGVTAVDPVAPGAWRSLLKAMPNPFHGQVLVRFQLPTAADVDLRVFGLDGGEVARLARGTLSAGIHDLTWSGRDGGGREVASGIYFVRLAVNRLVETRRVVRLE